MFYIFTKKIENLIKYTKSFLKFYKNTFEKFWKNILNVFANFI